MGFSQNVYSMMLHNKVPSYEIREALNIMPLLQIERSQLWFSHVSRISQERLAREVLLAAPWANDSGINQRSGGMITSLASLVPCGAEPAKLSEIAESCRYFKSFQGC